MRAEIKISGIVQGVGFRPFIYRIAVENGLAGYVRNRGDAVVEIVVEGKKAQINQFLSDLREEKPPLARVYKVDARLEEKACEFKGFRIIKSSEETALSGSVIPPDISICDECLKELRDPQNLRWDYFFITCTDCGPRFTIIDQLPFDRLNTTMRDFPMCNVCLQEYLNPSNRRFHAQTIACKKCGPRVYLTTNDGQLIENEDPIRETGKLLEEGFIVAIKGNGGFHVATATTRSEPIMRLRRAKHRTQKPFAIMARDVETVETFSEVSREEVELLTSYIKPIVLLRKNRNYHLSELVSPGLYNVGVMLPYTGLHAMLFDEVSEPAFVMTSANPPSEPIIVKNQEAVNKLGSLVDFFLFHNRAIALRCDDSVVRLHSKSQKIIRRSRGYAPEPIQLKPSVNRCTLGIGAELNVTFCVLSRDKAFISQHIGDVERLETLEFLRDSVDHLIKLTNSKVEGVASDMHPKFITTMLANELGHILECPVVPVQHHHSHIRSLMGEYGMQEIVGIACDGFGYGLEGDAWGGEILYCNNDGFQRLGHLQEQPMVGGDLATQYPIRMAVGMLHNKVDVEEWLFSKSSHFPHGEKEVEVILKQLKRGATPKTTSCGRVLDAVSALLDICQERTYEGEPAMKLESVAREGENVLNLEPKITGKVIDTSEMICQIFELRGKIHARDLAYSAQSYLARCLAQLAIDEAERLNIDAIGFSGGVAYNEHIAFTIKKVVNDNGFKFFVHNQLPPGDGGISFGQAIVATSII